MLKTLRSWDAPRIIQLVTPVFVENEPICKALGITSEDFRNTFQNVIEECCDSGLSTAVVVDNEPISVSLALSYKNYVSTPVSCEHRPIMTPLLNVLDHMENHHPVDKDASNSTAYHFIVGTHANHMNKGYAHRVIKGTIDMAKHQGFTSIVADATNIVSQHVLEKSFLYKPIGEICYASFKHENRHVFHSITPYTKSLIRMRKDLY